MQKKYTFHLLPNAHLDPVWLWDWREGLNEGLITVRTVLDLMDEFPELTFIRGESAIYEHIEKTDPATFDRLAGMVEAGRWDVVGGTYVQPDSNLASTESLCRQYETGMEYFASRFGQVPTVAWQADSFGHSPGFPSVLSAFGIRGFAFTRPQRQQFPMESPAFVWHHGGQRVLCYRQFWRWYCSERGNLREMLDATLEGSTRGSLRNAGVLMGLGNHGGGPTRAHLREVALWAENHPEVNVRFSTLHGFFSALEVELRAGAGAEIPDHCGDLGFCLRGCYSSAMRFKRTHRLAEADLNASEVTGSIIEGVLGLRRKTCLDDAWKATLFNTFHDVLPGSSIERAMDDQVALAGRVLHESQSARLAALNELALLADTRVPAPSEPDLPADVPVLVWNSLPASRSAWVELEVSLDYRPIRSASAEVGSLPLHLAGPDGERPEFQEIPTEHRSMREMAWRKRILFRTELPPLGWKIFRMGFSLPGELVQTRACPEGPLEFDGWQVSATPGGMLEIQKDGKPVFPGDGLLKIITCEDPWGSWGGMEEEADSLVTEGIRDIWRIEDNRVLENGPLRAVLWTCWRAGNSQLDLTLQFFKNTVSFRLDGRLHLCERSARVKMVIPAQGSLSMQVPAGEALRNVPGHLPCGRWVRVEDETGALGLVSDVLSDVDFSSNEVRMTLARATRYADDVPTPPDACPWLPAMDSGLLRFRLEVVPGGRDLGALADNLLVPPFTLTVPAHPGRLGAEGSLGSLTPDALRLLALHRHGPDEFVVRLQNESSEPVSGLFQFGGQTIPTGLLSPWEIRNISFSPPASPHPTP